ncbi:MAG TPA: acyl-CoA thioesterase [Acidimicrobiales bacterium]|nr:acyl-CoA thioesterase [Acidimicrobiales bacterium]
MTVSGDGPMAASRFSGSPAPTRLAVRWRDLDPLGHVNSAVFLTYLDEGRAAWLTSVLGDGFDAAQYVVARIELDYRSEIPLGTPFVETSHLVTVVGRSSVTFDERLVTPDGVVVAEGRTVLVMWEPARHHSRPLSAEEHGALMAALAH